MARLSEKPKSDQFVIWKKRVKIARELHRQKVVEWADKVIREYSGDANTDGDSGERYTQIAQVVMAVEENVQPNLFFQRPEFFAKAKQKNSPWEGREDNVAAIVNYEFRDIQESGHTIELENELCILDARLLPYGVMKHSYEAKGTIVDEQPVIESQRTVTERVNPLHVYLDYAADHITKQRFTVHRMDVPKEDLETPRYDQKIVESIEPSVHLLPNLEDDKGEKTRFESLKDDREFKGIRIFEIHDLENRVVHTLADGAEDFIEFNAPYIVPEGSQFSFLWFIEKPNEVYPMPPLKFYRKRASEFSYVLTQISRQIDKFMPKIFVNIDVLDKPAQERLKAGNIGSIVAKKGGAPAVEVFEPKFQKDLLLYMNLQKEMLNLESGLPDTAAGNPDPKRKATQDALIARGAATRLVKPQKRVKSFLLNQSKTIWMIKAKNAPFEHFVKVLGLEEATEWWNDPEVGKESWTDENLKGDYFFDYNMESVLPPDTAKRKKENLETMATVMNPAINQMLARDKKRLRLDVVIERFVEDNLGFRDISKVIEDLNVLDPEEEHDLWMQGQYPPITEDERNTPELLMEHFVKHKRWIDSPAFKSLPPELQQGALGHLQSYIPLIGQIDPNALQGQPGGNPQPQVQQSPNIEENRTPGEALVDSTVGGISGGLS